MTDESRRAALLLGSAAAATGYLGAGSAATNPQKGVATRIIDTHHHMIPPFYVEAVGAQNIAATMPSGVLPEWSVQKDLELMDRYDIGRAVLSASPGLLSITGARAAALRRISPVAWMARCA